MKKIFSLAFALVCFAFTAFAQLNPSTATSLVKNGPRTIQPITPASPDLSAPPPEGGPEVKDRMVYFVHGLGGGIGAWAKPAQATQFGSIPIDPSYPARKIRSFRPTFTQQGTIADAGADLKNFMQSTTDLQLPTGQVQGPEKSFVVAHSLGGLCSRSAGDQGAGNSVLINGIATFGSPHQGALFSNNVAVMNNFLTDFCIRILNGPNATFGWLLPNTFLGENPNDVCSNVSSGLNSSFNLPILQDFAVGAPGVSNLGDGAVDNKVAFVGIENEEVLWRELWHIINPASDYPLFGANDQQTAQNAVNTVRTFYANQASFWRNLGFNNRARKWQDGFNALNNANASYKELIGGQVTTTQVVQSTVCNCITYSQPSGAVMNTYVSPAPCTTYTAGTGTVTICQSATTPTIVTVVNQIPNDGVVPEPSQSGYAGAHIGTPMIGSNHQSMRNDKNTKTSLLSLLTGGNGIFFATPKRD